MQEGQEATVPAPSELSVDKDLMVDVCMVLTFKNSERIRHGRVRLSIYISFHEQNWNVFPHCARYQPAVSGRARVSDRQLVTLDEATTDDHSSGPARERCSAAGRGRGSVAPTRRLVVAAHGAKLGGPAPTLEGGLGIEA